MKLRQGGHTVADIVRRTNVPISRVRNWVRDVDVPLPIKSDKVWIIATRVPSELSDEFQELLAAAGDTVSGHLLHWCTRVAKGQLTLPPPEPLRYGLGSRATRVLTARVPSHFRAPVESWLSRNDARIGIVLRQHIEDCCREGKLL